MSDAAGTTTADGPNEALAYEAPRRVETPAADVGALALRLLAVKCALDLVDQLPLLTSSVVFGDRYTTATILRVGLSAGFNLAVALVLLAFARPIANAVFGRGSVGAGDLGLASWMALIVAGVGLALAVFSAGDLATAVARHGLHALAEPSPIALEVAVPLVKLAAGATLFLKPSILVHAWLRRVAPRDD